MTSLLAALLVGVGGTAGALARYAVDAVLGGRRATFAVNVAGSLVLGVASTRFAAGSTPSLLVGTGFCGAFTTFSSFAVAVAEGTTDGDGRPLAYAAGTLLAAVVAVLVGRAVA